MGCHTWCYSHIPEKAEEWNKEYADTLIKSLTENIEYFKNMSAETLDEYADEENTNNKYQLERFNELEQEGKKDWLINTYFNNNADYYEKYKDDISHPITGEDIRQRQIDYSMNTLNIFNKYGSDKVIEFIEDNADIPEICTTDTFGFGLYLIHDGKIYRDTCHYRGEGYHEDPVFEKQFHDIFRISDYDADMCYSYMDTIERCGQYNVKMDEHTYKRIKEFWDTYPDSIIEFG